MLHLMARTEKDISLKDVRKLARLQCTRLEAAAFLGIRKQTFDRLIREDERVRDAWEQGKQLGKISLRRKQFKLADDSAPMAIFLGKQYLDQREIVTQEHSGRDGGPIEFDASELSQEERDQMRALVKRGVKSEENED